MGAVMSKTLPDIYTFLDAPCDSLSPAARLITHAMRDWATAAASRVCPLRLVAPRFVLAGQAEQLGPFHMFMLAFARGAARPVRLGEGSGARIGDDEAQVLVAIGSLQAGRMSAARFALASLISAHELDNVVHAAAIMAFGLRGQANLVEGSTDANRRSAA